MMTHPNNPSLCTRRLGRFVWALTLVLFLPSCAIAHTSLEAYVQESFFVSLGTENIDVRVQVTFPSALSLVERRVMDSDADGKLSETERETYLKAFQARAEKLLKLTVNGQPAALIPLEDPALDLQDAPGVEEHPHELRLAYFARVPKGFGAGGVIALDSGLWAELPLKIAVETEAADGIRFKTVDARGLRPPSKQGATFRATEARCVLWKREAAKNERK